ncbi:MULTISPECIES: glycosyltransferase family 2 protein [Caballeronia]|uniref:Glycosyl transferase n=1 Tax=Caballeronia zhejiangensis TaxID=871203 RepID=A0A656QFV4_9BURK|nr:MULTISPECIES: glycosyltransferase family 2 protein [Caballeronia]EKS67488.1 glycosyl transferase family protein [Burkholderia sp. SJ98]KDR26740.1 glycosyl transferase [Caballeronia zhejiangensis]MDR5789227.1 glycosyltransferase family 2 protein [Caballeronia sp. LP003]
MTSSPLVTVVMPAFNAQAFIGEAIASIRAQTLEDWELIVVDDGSIDQTFAVAQQAAGDDSRVRLIRFGRNEGISAASNAGFDAARGEFIARIDSDDRALPTRLAAQVAAFRECARLAACGGHARLFGDGIANDTYGLCTLGDGALKARLFEGFNTIGGAMLMVRRSFVREHRIRFDMQMASAEDLNYLVAIMVAGGEIGNVDEVLVEVRSHRTSFTRSREDLAGPAMKGLRKRLLALWYPSLGPRDIDLIVGMWFGLEVGTDELLAVVRAVDRLIAADAKDFGQDVSVLHDLIVRRLVAVVDFFRGAFDASHFQAIRVLAAPAIGVALDAARLSHEAV